MTGSYLPAILVPIVGIIFPAFGMALLFIYVEKNEIAQHMSNFWENIARYPKFFISSVIGLIVIITSPLRKLNKNVNGRFIFIALTITITGLTLQIFRLMLEIEL